MIWLHKFKAEGCLDAETAGYRQMHRQNAVHKPQVFNLYKYKIINKKKLILRRRVNRWVKDHLFYVSILRDLNIKRKLIPPLWYDCYPGLGF